MDDLRAEDLPWLLELAIALEGWSPDPDSAADAADHPDHFDASALRGALLEDA